MSPDKKSVIASVAVRAFITGSFVCFINACIAGKFSCKQIKIFFSDEFLLHAQDF